MDHIFDAHLHGPDEGHQSDEIEARQHGQAEQDEGQPHPGHLRHEREGDRGARHRRQEQVGALVGLLDGGGPGGLQHEMFRRHHLQELLPALAFVCFDFICIRHRERIYRRSLDCRREAGSRLATVGLAPVSTGANEQSSTEERMPFG
ncbi:hypothetical protein NKJ90_28685 [Mesorhizobium sp. M0051]|uniref:hypothetical protein n=1 Tax=unclassified Mesorhizobium TaxID=325217 RepID=UPI00333AB3BB